MFATYFKKAISIFLSLTVVLTAVPAGNLWAFAAEPAQPFVMLIQDAHAYPEIQKQIHNLIYRAVHKNSKGKMVVALEGASGELHPEFLDFFPGEKKINRAIAKNLLTQGELTAAEFAAWENHLCTKKKHCPEILFTGVEDPALYRENLRIYRELLSRRPEIDRSLAPLRQELKKLQSRIFSRELSDFLKERTVRREIEKNTEIPIARWFSYLAMLASKVHQKLGIDLREPIEQLRFPNLVRALSLSDLEASLDVKKIKLEKRKVLALLDSFAFVGTVHELPLRHELEHFDQSPEPRKVLESIWKFSEEKKIPLGDYPNYLKWLGVLILRKEIDAEGFFQEMDQLEGWMIDSLVRNQKERKFLDILRRYEKLERLLHLEFSRNDYYAYSSPSQLLSLLSSPNVLIGDPFLSKMDSRFRGNDTRRRLKHYISEAFEFYRLAERREKAIFRNAMRVGAGASAVILVAGGFHADGLASLIEAAGLKYDAVKPKPPANAGKNSRHEDLRESVFLDQNAAFGAFADLSRASKQEILFLKGLLEIGGAALSKEKHFPPSQIAQKLAEAVNHHPVLSAQFHVSATSGSDHPRLEFSRPFNPSKLGPASMAQIGTHSVGDTLLLSGNYRDLRVSLPRSRNSSQSRLASNPQFLKLGSAGIDIYMKEPAAAVRSELRLPAEQAQLPLQPPRIGVTGIEASLHTILMLDGAGYKVSVVDQERAFEQFSRMDAASRLQKLIPEDQTESAYQIAYNKLVAENDVIYINVPFSNGGGNYQAYKEKLFELARQLGDALQNTRVQEAESQGTPPPRKIFVVKALVGVETSERIFEIIKAHGKPAGNENSNFDVVYQPDFSYYDRSGSLIEPYVVFGLRNDAESEEINATRDVLRSIYSKESLAKTEVDFLDIRSTEQAKDALLLYLGTKLAHFDDLAQLSDRYGADLSAVALGAGLDKRIRTLFTNPSFGFGGRLLLLLRWMRTERLNRAVAVRDGRTQEEILGLIHAAMRRALQGEDTFSVLETLPPDLHVLFWLESILHINKRNQENFINKIERTFRDLTQGASLRGKSVAVIGVGYSHRSGQIVESPALRLVRRLIKEKGVKRFYISDPNARLAFEKWVVQMRKEDPDYESIQFDFPETFYETVEKADLTIIATNSNSAIAHLDLDKLSSALKGKPLFDGINLFGLRASARRFYSLESVRAAGINLVSVGRPNLGRAIESQAGYQLTDSAIFRTVAEYPVHEFRRKNVAIIGGGYVGLVTGANLSGLGHRVHVVEHPSQQARIDGLNDAQTLVPIYEPGLREFIVEGKREETGVKERNLFFSTDLARAVRESSIIYLAVGTPQKNNGEIDLSYILGAASQIGDVIQAGGGFKTIVIKSTVTPNTFEEIERLLSGKGLKVGVDYALASNPEFLREGQAMADVTQPDRTVLGIYAKMPLGIRQRIQKELLELWYPLMAKHPHEFLVTDTASSTLIKYLANSFLAVSISLSNVLAHDTEVLEADFFQVRKPLKKDHRIGDFSFLDAGCGYGGSCFPKDVRALDSLSLGFTGHSLLGIRIADTLNEHFKATIVDKLVRLLTPFPRAKMSLDGKTIAIWGITFKPNTDDVREASSVRILYELLARGVRQVRLHDPIFNIPQPKAPPKAHVIENFLQELYKVFKASGNYHDFPEDMTPKSRFERFKTFFQTSYVEPGHVVFVDDPKEAVNSLADALLLVTDWKEYVQPGLLADVIEAHQNLVIVDGRNQFGNRIPSLVESGSFTYAGVGVPTLVSRPELRRTDLADIADVLLPGTARLPVSTAQVRATVSNVGLPNIVRHDSADTLLQKFPVLRAQREVAHRAASLIFPPLIDDASLIEPSLRLYQLDLAPGFENNGNQNAVLNVIQKTLDAKFVAEFAPPQRMPEHLIAELKGDHLPMAAVAFAGLAGTEDRLTFISGLSADEAAQLEMSFRKTLRDRYHLKESSVNTIRIVSSSGRENRIQTAKRVMDEDRRHSAGVLHESLDFLHQLGYVHDKSRFHADGLDENTSVLVAALLLRNPLQDDFAIRNLRQEMEAHHIGVNDFVQQIGHLISVLQHISTQA